MLLGHSPNFPIFSDANKAARCVISQLVGADKLIDDHDMEAFPPSTIREIVFEAQKQIFEFGRYMCFIYDILGIISAPRKSA